MFPQLRAGRQQKVRSELTAVQQSVAKLQRRRQFSEGEEVVVYDNHTKVSSSGNIVEVLGNNTYLADCGNGPKHVSGDLISRVSETATRNIGGEDIVHQEIGQEDLVDDDNMSIVSDSSFGSEILTLDDVHVVPQHNNLICRKPRTRVDRIGHPEANLPLFRLRR